MKKSMFDYRIAQNNIIVGGLVLAIPMVFIPEFLGLFLLSAICTAGVGMLFWISIAYMIGLILLFLYSLTPPGRKITSQVKQMQNQVEDYATSARSFGLSEQQIRENLIRAGWESKLVSKTLKKR
ncbi:MAG: hypothetical protein COU65_04190 [Candidatus Pacebacteria bacterium CG10_big_fil_rev_8_21_14_0_10_42_12]|nr:MAG: hypothetical protein COU65_04190 [Candidatus Pacebacteria bacterium CG10_big_fil_rev_8_21_14_0_10_42_12]